MTGYYFNPQALFQQSVIVVDSVFLSRQLKYLNNKI